jgi:hypothetical protein
MTRCKDRGQRLKKQKKEGFLKLGAKRTFWASNLSIYKLLVSKNL